MAKLSPDFVPATMHEAVDAIVASLQPDEIEFINNQSAGSIHHSTGMRFRNDWSFWEPETPIKRDCVEKYKIAHADDMSGLMLDWVWAQVRGLPFDPLARCEEFHTHWKFYDMSSLQAGGYRNDGTLMEDEERRKFYDSRKPKNP